MKTRELTLGGLLVALTIIILYLTLILQHNTLALLTIASFMVSVALIRGNAKTAYLVYLSSALLSFFLLPPHVTFLYGFFFGLYSIIKYFIESIKVLWIEFILKLIFFNSILSISFIFMRQFLVSSILETPHEIMLHYLPQLSPSMLSVIFWLAAQLAFLILDYALTLLIDFYYRYFSNR